MSVNNIRDEPRLFECIVKKRTVAIGHPLQPTFSVEVAHDDDQDTILCFKHIHMPLPQ